MKVREGEYYLVLKPLGDYAKKGDIIYIKVKIYDHLIFHLRKEKIEKGVYAKNLSKRKGLTGFFFRSFQKGEVKKLSKREAEKILAVERL